MKSIPHLIASALKEEVQFLLQRGTVFLLERFVGPSTEAKPRAAVPYMTPDEDVVPPHKNTQEAIAATYGAVAEVRSETRERRKWSFLMTEDEPAKVAEFFGRPGAETRVGHNTIGKRLVAVWQGSDPKPDSEPVFG
jgi:hypothetical protein